MLIFKMRPLSALLLGAILLTPQSLVAQVAATTSLREIVPTEAHMAVVYRRNAEQDYQREHLREAFATFQQERIIERVIQIIRDRAEADDMEQAESGLQEIKEAAAPASLEAIADAEEVAYCQVMENSMANHLLAVRMTPEAVQGYLQAAKNLLALAEEKSNEDIDVAEEEVDGVKFLTVYPPNAVPMQPTLVAKGDVLLLSTSESLARSGVAMLDADSPDNKFSEQRVIDALSKLPEAEDSVMIFDGKQQLKSVEEQLLPVIENLRQQVDENPKAAIVVRLMEAFIQQSKVMDLEVTVGYTEDGANHTESIGALVPGSEGLIVRKVIEGNKPLEDWSRWVPADAVNFRLNSGFSVLQVYRDLLDVFSREAPELAAEAMIKLEEFQQQVGVNLEDDLLGLFSGQTASVTLPGGQSVTALACEKPDRTRELLHRVIDVANQFPQVQTQQLRLEPSEVLEGFEDLKANLFQMVNARPVIGFKDGWMIVASTPEAAQAVLDVRWGDAADITSSESYKRFGLDADGPLSAITYADTAANIRQAAQVINQVAAMGNMFVPAMMAEAKPEDQKTVQQVLGLLPSIARVVQKFDFLEATLSINEPGSEHGTYHKHSVVLIRQD